jgi:hypothetical protein
VKYLWCIYSVYMTSFISSALFFEAVLLYALYVGRSYILRISMGSLFLEALGAEDDSEGSPSMKDGSGAGSGVSAHS